MSRHEEESRKQQEEFVDNLRKTREEKRKAEMVCSEIRKAEIAFVESKNDFFSETVSRKLYRDTLPIFDDILTSIHNLLYEVDRLDDSEYENELSKLKASVTKLSLAVKKLVIEEDVKSEQQ